MAPRRFPAPWTAEETPACFISEEERAKWRRSRAPMVGTALRSSASVLLHVSPPRLLPLAVMNASNDPLGVRFA
jgi:hypothetical protein